MSPMSPKEIAANARAKRIKLLIKMTGLSNLEFSKKSGISISTLNTWLYCLTDDFLEKAALRMIEAAEKLGLVTSMAWLREGYGLEPRFKDKLYNMSLTDVSNGGAYDKTELFQREIQFYCDNYANAVTAFITDHGMSPAYALGDCVGGQLLSGKELEKALDQNCIIKTQNGDIFCRHLKADKRKNRFNFYTINPSAASTALPVVQYTGIISAAPITRVWRIL